jgi:Acetyltransferase (GNAT) domain
MSELPPSVAAATGYLHGGYADALAEFGTPVHLPRSGGWILERAIAGGPERDAMGCYPLFACADWSRLGGDLDALGEELVSLVLVADPFGAYELGDLQACFPDRLVPFKEHFAVDFEAPMTVSKHHRYYARRALASLEVAPCADPAAFLDDWTTLYETLVERHGLTGPKAFSPQSFAGQLAVPGMVMFGAREQGAMVGAHLWYVQGNVGYSHLAAVSPRGYELTAAYALHACALEYFKDRVRWLDLGAGAGVRADAADGLARFKRGWANASRPAYLCGRIFDADRYAAATAAQGIVATDYFPAYRSGELG